MNHFVRGKKLGRTNHQRKVLLQGLVEAMVLHGAIETTLIKAKYLRPYLEKLITKAKPNDLAARRYLLQRLIKKDIVSKMLDEVAPLFKERNGGYTRIQRTKIRSGDRAEMAKISLVENLKPKALEPKEVKAKKVKEDTKLVVEKAVKKPTAKTVKKAEVKE
jgi:large subunit ribosomal protein L17